MTIDQLELTVREARLKVYHLEGEMRAERNARIDEIDADIQRKYSEELSTRKHLLQEAEDALADARVAQASSGEGAPYPLGTVVCEWDMKSRWDRQLVPTGLKGVIEIVTRDSEHGIKHGRAQLGTFIIRHLKKDGTKGKKYERCTSWAAQNRWLPEWQQPTT